MVDRFDIQELGCPHALAIGAVGLLFLGERLFETALDHGTVDLFICGSGGTSFLFFLQLGESGIIDIQQGSAVFEITGKMVFVEFQFCLVAGKSET